MDFTVSMALFDLVPCIIYLLATAILRRYFFTRMNVSLFSLYCAGTGIVTVAGICKALWKLLYALGVCDFRAFNDIFMPGQAIGFVFTAAALLAFVFSKNGKDLKLLSAPALLTAPAPVLVQAYTSNLPFIIGMCLGVVLTEAALAVLSFRKKKTGTALLWILSMFLLLGMGYLSSKDFSKASYNWIAEGVNFAAMTCQYLAARQLTRD